MSTISLFFSKRFFILEVFYMVLKTGPDRSVQLSVDHGSGSVWPIGSESDRTRIGLFELIVWPANQTNRLVCFGPNNSFSLSFSRVVGISIVAWSVILSAIPLDSGNPATCWKALPPRPQNAANPIISLAAPLWR